MGCARKRQRRGVRDWRGSKVDPTSRQMEERASQWSLACRQSMEPLRVHDEKEEEREREREREGEAELLPSLLSGWRALWSCGWRRGRADRRGWPCRRAGRGEGEAVLCVSEHVLVLL